MKANLLQFINEQEQLSLSLCHATNPWLDRFPFKAVPGETDSVEYPNLRIVNHVTGVFHERWGCSSRRR
jgi:hypothetical protein